MHVRDFVSGDFGGSAKRPYDQAFPTHQMPAAAPPAVVSPQQPMSRIVQLERRNAELNKEVDEMGQNAAVAFGRRPFDTA